MTEILPIAVSAHKRSRQLTTVQFFVQEKMKLGDQFVGLNELKDRYPHLRNLPNQTYNLNDVQVNPGQECYNIHHTFEFKKSEDKAASWEVKSETDWTLNGLLPTKQAAILEQQQNQLQMINYQTSLVNVEISSPTPQTVMSTDIRKRKNEQSRCWSKQRVSMLKIKKLDFCGEKTK